MSADIHQGLTTTVLSQSSDRGIGVIVSEAKQLNGTSTFGLHVTNSTYNMGGGVTVDDMLRMAGLKVSRCVFVGSNSVRCVEVKTPSDAAELAVGLADAHAILFEADKNLQACGFYLESREFPAKEYIVNGGNGHVGSGHKVVNTGGDPQFDFAFTWLAINGEQGWTFHYHPKIELAPATKAAFGLLGLREFQPCPEFESERCWWRRAAHREVPSDRMEGSNTGFVNEWFRQHETKFSNGLSGLVAADSRLRAINMSLL